VDIRASSHLHENLELPLSPSLYTFSTLHCMTVSLAAGGAGLGAVWGEQVARRLLGHAGFEHVELGDSPRPSIARSCAERRSASRLQ
jgi:hypothetical protein